MAAVLAVAGYLIYRWMKTDGGANVVDRVRIATPPFGNVWLKYQVGLFSRTPSTLLTGGLPLVPSLETAARSIDSRQIGNAVSRSVETVREGKGLSESLSATKVFPELAIEMIEVGESTGALPQMLNSVAEFFEEDVQTNLTAAMSLIELVDFGCDGASSGDDFDCVVSAYLQFECEWGEPVDSATFVGY